MNRNKVRCDACRASNSADRDRCRICTAPLAHDGPTHDALWSQRLYRTSVSDKLTHAGSRLPGVIILVVFAAAALNFFVLGYGPDWAHRQVDLGGSWKTVAAYQPDIQAELPGQPEMGNAGNMTTARVVVNRQGEAVLDGSAPTPNEELEAKNTRIATLTLGVGTLGGGQVGGSAGERVRALAGSDRLRDVTVGPQETNDDGSTQVEVTGTLDDYPAAGRTSTVDATLLGQDDTVIVAVTTYERSPVEGLHQRLVDGITLVPSG
ncbi:MAG: hypothetical protein R2704_11535 [Microthrixaceae bacterium]